MRTTITKKLLALSILLLFCYNLCAQVDPAIIWQNTIAGDWTESYGLTSDFKCQTNDGGYIICTPTNSSMSGDKTDTSRGSFDIWVLKLDNNGVIQWQKTIGGLFADGANIIKQIPDGGYIIGAGSNSNISGEKTENSKGNFDYWILKLDELGNIIWQKTIGGSDADEITSLNLTSDGGYIVGGISSSPISGDKLENTPLGERDFWILKLDSTGNIEWQNTFNSIGNETYCKIEQTADGGYFLAGDSYAGISGDKTENSNGVWDLWVLKLDAIGNIVWQNTLGGNLNEEFGSSIICSDGGYLVGAASLSSISGDKTQNGFGGYDYWIVKLSSTGAVLWDKTYGGTSYDFLLSLDEDPSGGYLLGGRSASEVTIGASKTENPKGYEDYWFLKIDELGNIEWDNTIGSEGSEYLNHVEYLLDGNIFLLGSTILGISADKTEIGFPVTDDIWVLKVKGPSHLIRGTIFVDTNFNCSLDSISEPGRNNKIVKDYISGNMAITNVDGYYSLALYNDTSLLQVTNLLSIENISCLVSDTISIIFDSTSSFDTVGINFPITPIPCYSLLIDMNNTNLSPCSISTFSVPYSNEGFEMAYGAYINVIVDTSILDSFSSSSLFTVNGDTLVFPLGNIAPDSSGVITFQAHVQCDVIIGTSACTRAYIYPLSNCPPSTVGYDNSDIQVETKCINDTVYTTLKNSNSSSDMTSPGLIQILEDDIIQMENSYQLDAGLSTTIAYFPSPGSTVTIKAYQNANHPQRPIIIMHDELCALTAPIKLNSVINHFSRFDNANEYEEVCSQILASFDPNIKSVVPQGYTAQHYTDSNQVLEYRIDFQNTGLDTARRVVVVDTLNSWLDINSFVPLVSSHSYTTQFVGSNIIHFIFEPIALPDSNVSEPNSHGYISFKIRPKYHTPKGTVINNFADIYFDYNAAVRTNTVYNTIYDTVLVRLGLGLNEPKESIEAQVLVFPNPTIDKFYIKLDQAIQNAQIKLVDMNGREVYEMNHVNGTQIEMKANILSKGVYFINIYDKNNLIARSKIVIQ